jgi:ABC-type Co2+ transport system permease subunit
MRPCGLPLSVALLGTLASSVGSAADLAVKAAPAAGGQQFSVLANSFVAGSAVPVVSSTGWIAGANAKF